ncbi:DUF2637 domain-containing protein, partial [Streptomyces sp. NPDC014646]|uniref:DUF2637 domain-containing protein n=1 Tax=Streptomyces sp. NPDC014646 TaxID=3364877 RepID=UPI0036FB6CAC
GRIADITADKHMEGVRLTRWLLSPVPTFRLWRRMKLWELRSYEQVIKLEQDRLIYQARLQARFGRSWRRKAPVESLMPLRLAKYGVPLAETAEAGLAAAGIEPALLPPAPALVAAGPDEDPPELENIPAPSLERQEEPPLPSDGPEPEAQTEPQNGLATETEPSASEAGPDEAVAELVLPDIAYDEAIEGYISQYGEAPNARQLGLFLSSYGIVDPATGGVLTEAQLRPFLQEFKLRPIQPPLPVADEPHSETDEAEAPAAVAEAGRSALADVSPAPVQHLEKEPSVPVQPVDDQVRAPSAGIVLTSATAPVVDADGDPTAWDRGVTEAGAATARLPEQQTSEPDLDPVQQQIVTVAAWVAEAEDAGQRLSGAEVARRLGVSARTGQRRLDKAVDYLAEQRQAQGRAHLRSVRT